MESLDLSPFATRADLEAGFQEQSQSSETLAGRMESVEGDLGRFSEQIEELQVSFKHIQSSHV